MGSELKCGLYPTMVTPFNEDLSVDYESLSKLISLFAQQGVDGVFAVCQSSEMFFLSDDEKINLAAFSIRECRRHGIKCVVSGHTQDDINEQINYLVRLEALKPDAIILVNNRLAYEDELESALLERLNGILAVLSPATRLGIYECPYPYKRIITDGLLSFMIKDGRFDFVKDTCCQSALIRHRLDIIKNSCIALYNANAATLYDSILDGCAGYSGIMLNIMPECFAKLKRAILSGNTSKSALLSDYIAIASVIEYQNYPANAKYILKKRGIFSNMVTRNGKPKLSESQLREIDAFCAINEIVLQKV